MNEPIEYRHAPAATDRTLRAMVATGLMILPLWALFTNHGWLGDVWLSIAIVCVPSAIIRAVRPARVWQTWLGVLLLVPWLTARFVGAHAIAGFIPSGKTWSDIGDLFDAVRKLSNDGVAPVHETAAVSFVLALVGGLLAAFVDLIAVVGRRAPIAGVPALIIYTVVGAVTRHPVPWQLFIGSAISFLILLSLDAPDIVRNWGRVVHKGTENRIVTGLGVSGTRIAIVAVAVAAVVPAIAPARTSNFIANIVHNGNGGPTSGGFGAGSGSASLNPFVALRGDLARSKPITLFTVTVPPGSPAPFYVRANVLSTYGANGWQVSTHDDQQSVSITDFSPEPAISGDLSTASYTATFTIAGLADNTPVFAKPTRVSGVDDQVDWSQKDQILTGTRTHRGQTIEEDIDQPTPTISELTNAPAFDTGALDPWLQVPRRMPSTVVTDVRNLTSGITNEFDKAKALDNFFLDPANGFVYSLTTVSGNSGSDLVDFLNNRRGFCQQYAGALAIMLRMAGVPARVVLGYTHAQPDAQGKFTVTTVNAHAWVEAYFDGLGWIPFDPTPLSTGDGGATLELPWAPHATSAGAANASSASSGALSVGPKSATASDTPSAGAAQNGGTQSTQLPIGALITLAVVVALVLFTLIPASVRIVRRRRRLRAGRRGDPDPLWAELSDTAIDLGYVWSPARSPRQVAAWLGGGQGGRPDDALRTLAAAVERARYSPDAIRGAPLVDELREVQTRLREQRPRTARLRARLLPASLGWRIRAPRRRNH
ncbi:MAG TPA: DUF3488 and transglutaminase-like domain-containing protein [Jatrophihabitantaceae bacterium]|nr:DUF3488 and transglutaminase-like domain-containing protein [Jatrophihabitantaceae bacterium]